MSSYTLPSLSDVLSPSVMLELSQRKSLDFGQTQSRKPLSVHDLITPSPKVHQREGAKNKRKRVSPSQLAVLNFTFEQTRFPSLELRMKLGKQLDMTPRAVQIWFQNKRQSIRTREKTIN
ncbi:Homeobox protein HD-10 [Choanephora cucurbitarum]|uniref:Homeobox protein HD-10 n=1 Tax=Choanephora cucurbitarum TaxID=101091 RepID=A0A1C7N2P8_9FUNG|nr:Homeobox protein HD-10 [Choanephora cucurbitarum]